ncbi:MAG: hypothetical protein ABIG37_02540 [Nanoarchaeota archaeon]
MKKQTPQDDVFPKYDWVKKIELKGDSVALTGRNPDDNSSYSIIIPIEQLEKDVSKLEQLSKSAKRLSQGVSIERSIEKDESMDFVDDWKGFKPQNFIKKEYPQQINYTQVNNSSK